MDQSKFSFVKVGRVPFRRIPEFRYALKSLEAGNMLGSVSDTSAPKLEPVKKTQKTQLVVTASAPIHTTTAQLECCEETPRIERRQTRSRSRSKIGTKGNDTDKPPEAQTSTIAKAEPEDVTGSKVKE